MLDTIHIYKVKEVARRFGVVAHMSWGSGTLDHAVPGTGS